MNKDQTTVKAFIVALCARLTAPFSAESVIMAVSDCLPADVEDAASAFEGLLGEGLITPQNGEKRGYSLSEAAGGIASELEDLLLPTARTEGLSKAVLAYQANEGGTRYAAKTERTEDGCDTVVGAYRGDKTLLEVRLSFEDEHTAFAAKKQFEAHPEAICAGIRALVTGNAEELS